MLEVKKLHNSDGTNQPVFRVCYAGTDTPACLPGGVCLDRYDVDVDRVTLRQNGINGVASKRMGEKLIAMWGDRVIPLEGS